MRVDVHDLANAAGAAVLSHYRPHPRYRSAVTGVAGAGLLPTVTVNRLNQDGSGTLSPPASRTGLRWLRGGGKTSDCGDFGQCRQRPALGKPRTSQADASETEETRDIRSSNCRLIVLSAGFPLGSAQSKHHTEGGTSERLSNKRSLRPLSMRQ